MNQLLHDTDLQIKSCLAYEILRDPAEWLGSPSTSFLESFLSGVFSRAEITTPGFPIWRIHGVLGDQAFSQKFVNATGRPNLSIGWATAIEFSHFSLYEGFGKLRDEALEWHLLNGVDTDSKTKVNSSTELDANQFWYRFAKRPPMYMGGSTGWNLFCFLNGMEKGGNWLGLNEMPELSNIFNAIKNRSQKSYGSSFGAFRTTRAEDLLQWAGLDGMKLNI